MFSEGSKKEKCGIYCRCRSDVQSIKVLYRGSVPELLQLYHRSPYVYWTTSKIQQIADQQIGNLGKIAHTTASGAFGTQMSLTRAGNIVTLYMFGSINDNLPAGSINFDEAVPSGYRPAYATGWVTIDVLNFSPSAAGRISVGTNGKMTGYMYSQANSGSHVAVSAVYATNDQWPS